MSDIAIDDVSLSPECFGLNIPESELNGYNYWNPTEEPSKELHKDFLNQTSKIIISILFKLHLTFPILYCQYTRLLHVAQRVDSVPPKAIVITNTMIQR